MQCCVGLGLGGSPERPTLQTTSVVASLPPAAALAGEARQTRFHNGSFGWHTWQGVKEGGTGLLNRVCWLGLLVLLVGLLRPLHAQTPPAAAAAPTPAVAQTPSAAAQAKRQRLALVVGIGMLGTRQVLDSARRDSEAVAAALRAGGFDVILRVDVGSDALQAAIKEFRERLQPSGVGLVYFTGLAAQVAGSNLLLPADLTLNEGLAGPAVGSILRAAGVPLQAAVDALAGGTESPRLLLVDAAYRHPALERLTPAGLARPRLPTNTMVLFGHAPGALQDPPSVTAMASPPVGRPEPKAMAASRFARVAVEAFMTPRISVPEALRAIRLSVQDSSGGLTQPWVSGDTFAREFLADAAALEAPPAAAAQAAAAASAPASGPAATAAAASAASSPAVATAGPTQTTLAAAATVAIVGAAPAVLAPPAVGAPAIGTPTTEADRRGTDGRTAQAPGRGERPVYQARANSFGHAEGDTLTYQVTDTRKDEVLSSYTLAIDEVQTDGHLWANTGKVQMDPQGRLKSQRDSDGAQTLFEPMQDLWWAQPKSGESRAVAYKETYVRADKTRGQIEWRGDAQVGSQRVLETPAGEFEVLPIKTTGQATDTPTGGKPLALRFTRTVWFAPKLGMPVAVDIEDTEAGGRVLRRERVELTHAQQARAAN